MKGVQKAIFCYAFQSHRPQALLGGTKTKLNLFFQVSNEKRRMRRFSDWVIIAGLFATLVLVYRLHQTKVAHKEAPEGDLEDFSDDVALLIDPPAGKATR